MAQKLEYCLCLVIGWPRVLNVKKYSTLSQYRFFWLTKFPTHYIKMGVMVSKLHFCWYWVMWWPWPLTFESQVSSEMLNTTPISLFWWTKVPTLYIKMGVVAPELIFCPCLVMWWPWLWPLTLNFQKCWKMHKKPVPISLFLWQKFPSDTLEWSYGSKAECLISANDLEFCTLTRLNIIFDIFTTSV